MKLKILVVGPSQSGKTSMTNVLGRENVTTESSSTGSKIPYYPTQSIRIVDFPSTVTGPKNQQLNTEIQLWEIGGDPKLKPIWPGVEKGADGIILLYRALEEVQVNEVSALHMHFVTHSNQGLTPSQCFVVGNNVRGMRELGPQKIIGLNHRARHIAVNVEDDVNRLREEFQSFISGVAQIVFEKERGGGQ